MNHALLSRRGAVERHVNRAIEHAFGRLRLDRPAPASAAEVEKVVQLLDTGVLDAELERQAPPVTRDLPRRRYADAQPFSHAAWKARHGVQD